MSPAYTDVSEATFEADVVQRSHEVPVVVDFWAAWCAPCRSLGPVLERLAGEADGGWALAKVDVDANQGLAAAFGVQGIPAVRAFKDGRQVAEFTGALPEPQVRQWLTQLGPSKADLAFNKGTEAEARADIESAADAYRRALDHDPGHGDATRGFARVDLKRRAAALDEREVLKRIENAPHDIEAIVALADLKASRGEIQTAFDRLLEAVRLSTGEERDRARRHLLLLLDTLPPDDPRVLATRRALSLALY